ncbi:MAG TPA: phosphopantetheine-binding protein [Candidatus Dormibacteraeota bacterium]|nr:phosphopantetheine-binding protein [Candidatus Dormibacteraeota bacterium]
MNPDDIRATVLRILHQVAPDVDAATLDPAVAIQDQVDIDSVDFMNLMVGIEEALGVDVPERDYPRVASLDACVGYLSAGSR